ncbi:YugN family protein [Psychrobacillus sp. FJAT-51614]|uniref:YugN family protein n=1 Tax=Psychrobacillus mangrovi TaxID=3117745 RepID=A0ABU8F4U5_9BACI
MLQLHTELEGKKAYFGDLKSRIQNLGYSIGGNWDYHKGSFDNVLHRDGGETIYLRLPFEVLEGDLDHHEAYIRFQTPYVIKHVVNMGLDTDVNSLMTSTGFDQFQDPLDKDGQIVNKNRWAHAGEQAVQQVVQFLN